MSDVNQSSSGCWTCKARRKGCDLELPNCGDCSLLGIGCHYGQKPAWMDGGNQQKLKAEQLKREIKRNAQLRRGKNRTRAARRPRDDCEEADQSGPSPLPSLPERHAGRRGASMAFTHEPITPIATPPTAARLSLSVHQIETRPSDRGSEVQYSSVNSSTFTAEHSDFEFGLLMSYLDYAFPILFPYYKPSILEGGKAWLLTLALKHPAFYHNIIGLAACFYCAVPVLPGIENDACVVKGQTELYAQMEKAVQGVQDDLRDLSRKGVDHSLADSMRLVGNIVQLVNFEVVFASSDNWQIHLTAAVDLLSQIMKHHSCQDSSLMGTILEKLRGNMPSNCSIWSPEQAAFRFFTAMIIYQNIIACTVSEQAHTLAAYYDGILSQASGANQAGLLNLEDFVGCQNWILRSIAEISALDKWKKMSKRAGTLDMMDLSQRAASIKKDLNEGSARPNDDASNSHPQSPLNPYQPLETILAKSKINTGLTTSQYADQSVVSKIWVHAAHVYLTTVLSGWQPRNSQLRNNVAQALSLFSTIENPSWLKTLAWPFCVIGCLATEEQEAVFRSVAHASGGLAMFGTLRDALAIMERVWGLRNQLDGDTWDIASCLCSIGHKVLLI